MSTDSFFMWPSYSVVSFLLRSMHQSFSRRCLSSCPSSSRRSYGSGFMCELPKRQFTFLGRSPTRQSYYGFIGKIWIAISKSAQNRQILGQETKICYEPTSRNTRNIPVSSLRLQQREFAFMRSYAVYDQGILEMYPMQNAASLP